MTHEILKTGLVGRSPISVGRFTYGFQNITVRQWNEGAALRIGAFCSIAKNVNIFLGGNHRTDWITTFPFGHIFTDEFGEGKITGHPSTKGDVNIGNDVWIGTGVTIMSEISVGDGAVLSANACVVNDVAPYEIVGGNPAKSIKKRFDDEIIRLLTHLRWWDLPVDAIGAVQKTLCAPPDINLISKLIADYRPPDT